MDYTEYTGILGSRASTAFDLAYLILLLMIPILVWSLELLLLRKNYLLHKKVQLLLTLAFLIATAVFFAAFFLNGWRHRAAASVAEIPAITYMTLTIHLAFWLITGLIWIGLLVQSLRKIPNPPQACEFGPFYVFWLVMLVLQLFLTTLTGWEFYLLAFCF
jgi:hypothetical protein